MKITVYRALRRTGTYSDDWHWNARSSGRIVAGASGYNSSSSAVRAAVNHASQWVKIATGKPLTASQKSEVRAKVEVMQYPLRGGAST